MNNAGVLYSAPQREKYSAICRLSAVVAERMDWGALQRAVDKTIPQSPFSRVRIKEGAFWYYFEPNSALGPFMKEDIFNPRQPVCPREDNGWLIRFYYYEKRISAGVFHVVSDDSGALIFLKTLLAVYLWGLGYSIPNTHGILDVAEESRRAEREGAYGCYATVRPRWEERGKKACQNNGTAEPFYTFNVTVGSCSVARLKEKTGGYGVSITEYLATVLPRVIADKQHRERPQQERSMALTIPTNLRGWFLSETLYNFILTVRPSIDPSLGGYTLEEVLSRVHHYPRLNTNRQQMQVVIAGNMKFTTNRLLQIVLIVLKNPVMSLGYKLTGILPYSGTYTNPGSFPVSKEMVPRIHHVEVILGQATTPRPHCASMSYGDIMKITFTGTQKGSDTERDFFRFLVREDIPMRVEGDRTG